MTAIPISYFAASNFYLLIKIQDFHYLLL